MNVNDLKAGDVIEYICPVSGNKYRLTYTGTCREVKECLAYFFTVDDRNATFLWPSEVEDSTRIS